MYGYEHAGMGLWMILVWAIPIVLIVLLVRYFVTDRNEKSEKHGKSALEILEMRYARGEIDQEEFLKRRADLTG